MGQSKFSYELTFWFISAEKEGKQKSIKYLESRNQSILWWLTWYHEKFLCQRQNVSG